ncbi:uncharacterized protein GLRG_10458 [Colletotrichum graminicola M1.001]|uniref:Extracellular metalloproteinase n=1 Tax=Colletotrichum graminicola (strain M1.001 / M2 / FGSC 10212) TaxID=645133 RepID=E3QWS6_COLGM|nr:uncharacterized protein GLRG_10458 [Colletotrichum graminicola M1.001]EFQ35314.1 hypothetical protein GLRG_10458 [Colletotrichum graminicola M1.001]
MTATLNTYPAINGVSSVHRVCKTNGSFRPEVDSNSVPTDGKYLTLKLAMDGMAPQPCSPNFIQTTKGSTYDGFPKCLTLAVYNAD